MVTPHWPNLIDLISKFSAYPNGYPPYFIMLYFNILTTQLPPGTLTKQLSYRVWNGDATIDIDSVIANHSFGAMCTKLAANPVFADYKKYVDGGFRLKLSLFYLMF